jgi:deglycase
MARKLDGKKVAILVADGFEQVEMTKPREALDEAGAQTKIVSLKSGKIAISFVRANRSRSSVTDRRS